MNREELLKNAKPILFNTEMVQAILEGRKTVTRRVIKLQPNNIEMLNGVFSNGLLKIFYDFDEGINIKAPYRVGDIIYVRETWCRADDGYYYKAGFKDTEGLMKAYGYKWHPSIHMPKEIARIFLKVTDVRVERLQDITEMQVRKEGFRDYLAADDIFYPCGYYFRQTWDSTIKKQDLDKYGWEANPWVRVIDFERVQVENEH